MEGREAAAGRRGLHLDHVPSGAALSTAQMQKPLTWVAPSCLLRQAGLAAWFLPFNTVGQGLAPRGADRQTEAHRDFRVGGEAQGTKPQVKKHHRGKVERLK